MCRLCRVWRLVAWRIAWSCVELTEIQSSSLRRVRAVVLALVAVVVSEFWVRVGQLRCWRSSCPGSRCVVASVKRCCAEYPPEVESSMSKVLSIASVQSVASQSVASESAPVASTTVEFLPVVSQSASQLRVCEWRPLGVALGSVLSRLSVVVAASAEMSSVTSLEKGRMH